MGNKLLSIHNIPQVPLKSDYFSKINVHLDGESLIFYGFLIVIPFLESATRIYALRRQVRTCELSTTIPDEVKGFMKADLFETLRNKYIEQYKNTVVDIIWSDIFEALILTSDMIFIGFWQTAQELTNFVGLPEDNETFVSMTFVLMVNLVMSTPAFLIHVFRIRDLASLLMILDFVLEFVIIEFFVLPTVAVSIFVVETLGSRFFIYISIVSFAVAFAQEYVYPLLIFPVIENYTPLQPGALRENIIKLSLDLDFPLRDVYVKMENEFSSSTNAYVHSVPFLCHRIVLYEKLFFHTDAEGKELGLKDNEIAALVAHELGHWKLSHAFKKFFISQVKTIAVCAIITYLFNYGPMYTAIGFPPGVRPIVIGLFTIQYIVSPMSAFMDIFTNLYNRKQEFLADEIVVKNGYESDYKKALIRQEQVRYFPVFDRVFSCYHFSVPSLLERFNYMNKFSEQRALRIGS